MPYKYAYITGCLILLVIWLFMFLKRKDLRQEMLWASFLGMPFGFVDFFLIPRYWNPDSLFFWINKEIRRRYRKFYFYFRYSRNSFGCL
jgi:hypothetical protein